MRFVGRFPSSMGLIWFSLGLGGEILVIGEIFEVLVTFYNAVFHENLGTN